MTSDKEEQDSKPSSPIRKKSKKWSDFQIEVPSARNQDPYMIKFNDKIHPDLPKTPFLVCIVGKRNSGKSVLLYNLLNPKQKGSYGSAFFKENQILISQTYKWDPTLKSLQMKNIITEDLQVRPELDAIFARQAEESESGNDSPVLIAFEDITQMNDALNWMTTSGYKGRHINNHILYVIHKMSSIPRGLRTQTQQWIIFKPIEESERDWVLHMFSRRRTQPIWENALQRCWDIPYNFVFINMEEKEIHRIYRSGLHDPLFTAEEMAMLDSIKYFNDTDLTASGIRRKQIDEQEEARSQRQKTQ